MAVDTSIYFQNRNNVALMNPLDIQAKAQSLKSMASQQKLDDIKVNQATKTEQDNATLTDILKRNTVVDQTGKATLNRGAALSELYKANPQKAMEYQKQIESEDVDTLKRQGTIAKELAWSANQDNWPQIKAKAIELGMKNAEQLPDTYSPEFHQRWQMGTLAGEQQLQQRMDREKMDRQKEQDEYGKKRDVIGDQFKEKELLNRTLDRKEAREERRFQAGISLPQNVYAAATYGQRAEDSNKQMNQSLEDGYDATGMKNMIKNRLPEFAKGEDQKLLEQSQRNFVNTILRRESGAAISDSEFSSAAKQYFPQVGDTPEVLNQKQRNREVAIAGLKSEGARAEPFLQKNLEKNNSGNTKTINGQLYRKVDGGWLPASK